MKNIHDLHLQDEILPLFDAVCNDFSRDTLWFLLSEVPDSIEEVRLRQDILKGFIKSEELSYSFSYGKSEFNEVHDYVLGLKDMLANFSGRSLRLYFILSRTERSRERGRIGQLFIFFDKISRSYFTPLRTGAFPDVFADKLKNIHRIFSDLEVDKHRAIVRQKGLSITEMIKCMKVLGKKCENGEMDIFWRDFFLFEAYYSIAKGIKKHHFKFPEFSHAQFDITEFYHPLLKNPVKNSLAVEKSVTLITGPNMSGKSTLLKSIGLCVYLAHLGLAVPAEKCILPFFDVISIAINLNDDIRNGHSHFMTEILTLKNVVVDASNSRRCFAIFDELFRGTSVDDALVISTTTIAGLTKFRESYFFISTHLHQLKEAISENADKVGTHYIDCSLDNERPVFTYKLLKGWSDLKIGQIIFENEGLNELLGARRRC